MKWKKHNRKDGCCTILSSPYTETNRERVATGSFSVKKQGHILVPTRSAEAIICLFPFEISWGKMWQVICHLENSPSPVGSEHTPLLPTCSGLVESTIPLQLWAILCSASPHLAPHLVTQLIVTCVKHWLSRARNYFAIETWVSLVLPPNSSLSVICFWRALYCRGKPSVNT